jgi:hypothetical protein
VDVRFRSLAAESGPAAIGQMRSFEAVRLKGCSWHFRDMPREQEDGRFRPSLLFRVDASPSAERADVSEADMRAKEASDADGWETCRSFAPV